MAATADDRKPGLLSRIMTSALVWFYHRQGWTAEMQERPPRKFVLVAAPHTSNWDFLYFVGLTHDLGIRPRFMAKKELFRWPFTRFLHDLGGIPVDRQKGGNYVEAMIAEFKRRDDFILTVAPEGTRGQVRQWKTGFYHIAVGAGVPLVIGLMDYRRKVGGLGPALMPTGDYAADMKKIESFYHSVTPRHPGKAMTSIVAASDNAAASKEPTQP